MPKPVLNDTHYETICRLLAGCSETRDYLAKCKRCGLDVDHEIAENEQQIRIAEQIKREFFPDRP